MKKTMALFVLILLVFAFAVPSWGDDGIILKRKAAKRFATLPMGSSNPEGIAADASGNIYVTTFDFTGNQKEVHIFSRRGHLLDTIPLPGVLPLGLGFDGAGNLFVLDFGNGDVLKFEPPFSAASTPAEVISVCGGAAAGCGLNDLTFAADGNLYVSDSFGGNIFKIDTDGNVTTFVPIEPLLTTVGFPSFGANGLAFNADESALFVANTGNDTIIRIPIDGGGPGTAEVFAQSVNGADGIAFDEKGTLWVAANQADEIVGLNDVGRVIAKLGDFRGIKKGGSARGLLFPASLVIIWEKLFVTNLAIALTPPIGDEPEEDVTRYTVSRIRLPR